MSGIFQNLWRINFSLILFEISVKEKFFPSQIFQKVWVEKLILHSFWKIPLFLVILLSIICDNELKTIKYISPTKSIRRENLRHIFYCMPMFSIFVDQDHYREIPMYFEGGMYILRANGHIIFWLWSMRNLANAPLSRCTRFWI